MRPSVTGEARRPHLMPCPRCGSANGITAVACWQCDLELNPEPQPVQRAPLPPPPVLEEDVPVVESEVPPAMIEQIRARAAAAEDDGPRTLPPFAPPHDTSTANDPLFLAAETPATAKPSRLMLTVAGLTLAGAVAGLLLWSSGDGPAPERRAAVPERSATPAPRAAPVAVPAATVAAPTPVAVTPAPVPATPALSRPAQPPAVAAPQAAPRVAPAAVPPVTTAVVTPPQRVLPPPPRDAAPLIDASRPPQAVRPPPPVQAACTPQVAALALCTLESR
jgi:hypothetical protein